MTKNAMKNEDAFEKGYPHGLIRFTEIEKGTALDDEAVMSVLQKVKSRRNP
jgi:uncharacterized protein YqeY